MGLFDKVFGKKAPTVTGASAAIPLKATPPATLKFWDSPARMTETPREDWRQQLPTSFKNAWDSPDPLAGLIEECLKNGLYAEALEPARQLARIDPQPKRGAHLLGATLLQLKRYDEAGKLIVEALRKHGDDGPLLTSLARTFASRGDRDRAQRALWRGLEIDPNQDSGLLWFAATSREEGGARAEVAALQRVAALPGSWRPQLYLARHFLQTREVPTALAQYQEILPHVEPLTAEALMQISADLGQHGLLKEMTEMCAPRFDAQQHGLGLGNNLLKAFVDLRDAQKARRILAQLAGQQRPDWRDHLALCEREIEKLEKPIQPEPLPEKLVQKAKLPTPHPLPLKPVREIKVSVPEPALPKVAPETKASEPAPVLEPPDYEMLIMEGPIWARDEPRFAEILPPKPDDAVKIAFVGGSAKIPTGEHDDLLTPEQTSALGRYSRGLPMFLAERAHIKTSARALTLIPCLKQGGFLLADSPWTPQLFGNLEQKPDYAVFVHFIATFDPWLVQLNIVRLADVKSVAKWEQQSDPNDVAEAINDITKRTMIELKSVARVSSVVGLGALFPPTIAQLPNYVAGLEQSLAILSSTLAPKPEAIPIPERKTFDGLLELCLRETDNAAMRFLLLSTIARWLRTHPDAARPYRARVERLQRDHPLTEPAEGLAQEAMARIFGETDSPAA